MIDWRNPGKAGDGFSAGQSLQATFRRGWYFGSDAFREKLIKLLGREEHGLADKRRSGYTGKQARDHGEAEAPRIAMLAKEELGLAGWNELKKGDWHKGLIAHLIRQRSLVDNGWLAEHLAMGARTAVSRIMGEARALLAKERQARALKRRLEKLINQS